LTVGCIKQPSNNTDDLGEDFSFTALDGSVKKLSDYRGKIVLLDLWATWCGPCKTQMEELKKIYDAYAREDLEIFSVDIDPRESVSLIQSFLDYFKENKGIELDWIFGIDDKNIWDKYKLEYQGIPTVYIFDQEGTVQFSQESVAYYNTLKPIIDDIL